MSNIKKVNDQNISLQQKVFTRWISTTLKGVPNSNFTDITKDLPNGIALIELAQVLTHKKAPQEWEQQPTTPDQCVKNCKLAFKMFRNDGFKAIGITSKDICDNNEKQIIELVWQLISHYLIEMSFGNLNSKNNVSTSNIKSQLLSWAIRRTQNYKNVFAFKPYDLSMCALLDSYYPSKINYYVLDQKDHQKNFKLIMDVMSELKIPCLIYPEDVLSNNDQLDKKILLTQLALMRMNLEIKPSAKKNRRSNSRIQTTKLSSNKPTPLELNQDRLLKTQIANQRRAKTGLKAKNNNIKSRIPQKVNENIDFNIVMKPDQLNKEIQNFKDFNENNEIYEEDNKRNSKTLHLKIEKQDIEAQIADEFRGNDDAFKKDDVKKENVKPTADRRPQFINV